MSTPDLIKIPTNKSGLIVLEVITSDNEGFTLKTLSKHKLKIKKLSTALGSNLCSFNITDVVLWRGSPYNTEYQVNLVI